MDFGTIYSALDVGILSRNKIYVICVTPYLLFSRCSVATPITREKDKSHPSRLVSGNILFFLSGRGDVTIDISYSGLFLFFHVFFEVCFRTSILYVLKRKKCDFRTFPSLFAPSLVPF